MYKYYKLTTMDYRNKIFISYEKEEENIARIRNQSTLKETGGLYKKMNYQEITKEEYLENKNIIKEETR